MNIEDPAVMIGLAFVLGYIVRQFGLPPLVGFLGAGFLLRGIWGMEITPGLTSVADLGVTLMLFTIGLKLKAKDLAETPVWLGSTLHMAASIAIILPTLMAAGSMGVPLLNELTWTSGAIVAFALAFSSTVFAVVIFQTKGESQADYAKTAIGILIMQDIFAVIFLSVSKGTVPSWWAIVAVLGLIALRKPMTILLQRSGHGELLILSGLLLPLTVYELFEIVNLKGDLGALFVGVLLAGTKKADELSKLLFSFKELLLVAFFVSIGLNGDPSLDIVIVSLGLLIFIPIKLGLFYYIFTQLNIMARPSIFTSLSLGNYSEFGLIVGALAVNKGWIAPEWLLVFALALSISYVAAGPACMSAEKIYERLSFWLHKFQKESALPPPVDLKGKPIVIVGMGRMGTSTSQKIEHARPDSVISLDFDSDTIAHRCEQGLDCIEGDGTDLEFWKRTDLSNVQAILITMPNQLAGCNVVRAVREAGYVGYIGVTTAHKDENPPLLEAGADATYSIYEGAAEAFSELVCGKVGHDLQQTAKMTTNHPSFPKRNI